MLTIRPLRRHRACRVLIELRMVCSRYRIACSLILVIALIPLSREVQAMNCGQFLQICETNDKYQKTQRKEESAGRTLNPYCEEFLSRIYHLKTLDGHICPHSEMNSDDLLIVLKRYIARNRSMENVSAGIAIHNAFREAFPCGKSPP